MNFGFGMGKYPKLFPFSIPEERYYCKRGLSLQKKSNPLRVAFSKQ
jgi:hypothetical protein